MVTDTVNPSNQSDPDAYPDEATLAQQEAIENDIKASSPLISQKLPLSTLADDFVGHSVYLEKLDVLKKNYTSIRRLRRDGNCFYRAFGFAYLEYLLTGKRLKEAARLKQRCDECRDNLISLGYTQFTVEDFHEQFTSMIDRFTVEGEPLSQLEDVFNNQAYSDYYVVFLRLLVSAYMQKNSDFYMNFIDDGRTMKQFCEMEVEPMARESDNIHIAALALAVGIPIWVENCQQSGDLNRIEFPAEDDTRAPSLTAIATECTGAPANTTEVGESHRSLLSTDSSLLKSNPTTPVILLYRPGHYDILYTN